jgi:hypothetical protein
MALLLNSNSVILCPHGGLVMHTPTSGTAYRIEGRPPMLLSDIYTINGCPYNGGGFPNPCILVLWVVGSTKMLVRGVPVLTQASLGLCQSASGMPNGPAIITACQLIVQEPNDLTLIDQ